MPDVLRGLVCLRRGRQVLACVAACVLATTVWTWSRPPLYRATCVLKYPSPQPSRFSSDLDRLAIDLEWLSTQDLLLTSRTVLERAALELYGPVPHVGAESLSNFADALLAQVSIEREEGARLSSIAVHDRSPHLAARIANAVARAYLTERDLHQRATITQALGWLDELALQTDGRWGPIGAELRVLPSQCVSNPTIQDRLALYYTALREVSESFVRERIRRLELAAKVKKLHAAKRASPFDAHTIEVDRNSLVNALRVEHAELTASLRELGTVDASAGEARSAIQARLAAIRDELARIVEGITRSAEAELHTAITLEGQIASRLASLKRTGLELLEEELQLGRIERERAQARSMLDSMRDRIVRRTERTGGDSDGSIVQLATAPTSPFAPPYGCAVAIGTMTGLCAAGAAIVYDHLARRSARRRRPPEAD